jgi:hypothetical protein
MPDPFALLTRPAAKFGTSVPSAHCFDAPLGGNKTMRWKISHHGHDPRQIDLLAVLALLVVIVAAWCYFDNRSQPQSTSALIVPSQSVRW